MSTFDWLVLGHLAGDWLLQNDWMARGKKRGIFDRAGAVHFAIYTAAIAGALWLSGAVEGRPAALPVVAVVVYVSHWLLDAVDVAGRWVRFYRQSDGHSVRVVVDQTLHLLVLASLAAWAS